MLIVILILKYYSVSPTAIHTSLSRLTGSYRDHNPSHSQTAKCKILIDYSQIVKVYTGGKE